MRTLKTLLVCSGVTFLTLNNVFAQASDTEAQAKARQAVRDALQHEEGAGVSSTNLHRVAVPAADINRAAAKPVVASEARRSGVSISADAAPQPLVVPKSASEEAINKAREATRQKLQEVDGQTPSAVPNAAFTPVAKSSSTAASSQQASKDRVNASATDAANQRSAKASSAVAKSPKSSDGSFADPVAISPAPKAHQQQNSTAAKPANNQKRSNTVNAQQTLQPFEKAPSPLATERQQRLAELLKRYMTDEVSPEQYHAERAKILSEK